MSKWKPAEHLLINPISIYFIPDLLLGALLLLLLGLPRIEGASLVRHRMHHQKRNSDSRERYYEPCGSKTTAAPLDALLREVIIEDPLEEHLDILSKESEIAKRSVQDLMTRYVSESSFSYDIIKNISSINNLTRIMG